jgi:hypothetical protein
VSSFNTPSHHLLAPGVFCKIAKHVVVLTMKNEILPRPHDPGVIAWTEVYLATNQDMLQLVSTGAKKQ